MSLVVFAAKQSDLAEVSFTVYLLMEKKKSTLSYPLNSSNTEELKNLVLKLNGLILSQYLESLMR